MSRPLLFQLFDTLFQLFYFVVVHLMVWGVAFLVLFLPAKASLTCFDDCSGPIGNLELSENVGDVVTHCLRGNVKTVGDLLVTPTLSNQFEDFPLAFR